MPPVTACTEAGGGTTAATPHTAEASRYLQMMGLCDDAMFSVLHVAADGACIVLYVSSGVQQLLGYTPEEYLALGCEACEACERRREGATRTARQPLQRRRPCCRSARRDGAAKLTCVPRACCCGCRGCRRAGRYTCTRLCTRRTYAA